MESPAAVASVLIDSGLPQPLDYSLSQNEAMKATLGMRVQVKVRQSVRTGTIIDLKTKSDFENLLPIENFLSESAFSSDLFSLASWMSDYYLTPLNKILKSFLPTQVRKENFQPQTQAFVKRLASFEELRQACLNLREKHPSQVKVIEALLQEDKGLFLSELLEKTGVSRSPIETLAKKKLLSLSEVFVDRSPFIGEQYFKTRPKTLNAQQQLAVDAFKEAISKSAFSPFLLYGITGSGKTEVYLQSIEQALALGRSTIMLVPEISLTEQTIRRLKGRFDDQVAILHHKLSHGERHDQWHRIRRGEAKIVVGARSALFSPVQNLGLIIVDEEHDPAYKQNEERPTYHARDMAVMRAKLTQSVVILGSATPSIESMQNVLAGKYQLFKLDARATASKLAQVEIVDMKREYEKKNGYTSFCDKLISKMKDRLSKGEQTILFLNRRGYHTSMQCHFCGETVKCPHCDLAMTFHLSAKSLSCHLCSYTLSPPPEECPSCHTASELKFKGVGTEQIEKALYALLPQARVLRIDSDTTRHKGSHDKLLREFGTGKADILIGTQMIAKGLHFPSVTLVAILNADSLLNLPDFRAAEQTFQLITQVAGRAGRGELAGEVIIQTQLPTCPTILLAAEQDYDKFFKEEIESRKTFHFPPFSHLVKCTFSGPDAKDVEQTANLFRQKLIKLLPPHAYVFPVGPSGYAKIKDQYRFQFLIRNPSSWEVSRALKKITFPKQVHLHIDIDAISTFF